MKSLGLTNLALLLFLIVPSMRAVFKYAPTLQVIFMILYASLLVLLVYAFQNEQVKIRVEKLVGSYWYVSIILVVITFIVWYMYPIADGLKLQLRGSDQDDCVIIGANQLLSFSHPYTKTSYFGNPCSPGMGMILIYLPLVFFKAYPFGAIIFAALSILVMRRYTGSMYQAAFFATLLFGGLFQLEMLVTGSDLFVIGCGLVIASFELVKAITKKNLVAIVWIAVLVGLLSSTRVNFLVIAPIISIFIFIHWRKASIYFLVISASIAILPSAYVYLLEPNNFSPFHLLGKSDNLLQGGLKEIAAGLSLVTFFVGCYLVKKSVSNIPYSLFLSLAPSLLAVSIGDLLARNIQLGQWEGANYLLPLVPLAIAILIVRLSKIDRC